jgi:hypothetical protein
MADPPPQEADAIGSVGKICASFNFPVIKGIDFVNRWEDTVFSLLIQGFPGATFLKAGH